MAGDALAPHDADLLIEAARLEQALTQILRIALDETLQARAGLAGAEGAARSRRRGGRFRRNWSGELRARQQAVRALFDRLMEG